MLPNDDIFTVIKEHRLPVSRNFLPIADFLKNYFKEYIGSLRLALKDTQNYFLSKEFYKKLSDKLNVIEELCNDILIIYQLYDLGDMQKLYNHLDVLMCKVEKYLFIREIDITKKNIIPNFYRIRVGNDKSYSRKDLFHIPMDKRHLIKSYRYSIAGYPCLYLADSIELCWFECGMPKKFSISQFQFAPQNNTPLRLVDFSQNPIDLISVATTGYYNNPDEHDWIDDYILKYIVSHPLRAACSVNVIDRDTPFIQEYIMPQLLLLWVRKNDDFDGIAYLTASSIEAAHSWNSFNIALPAKDIKNGYCKKLFQMFKVSKPVQCDLSQIFKGYLNRIQTVREFTRKLEYIYLNGRPLYLYREILSLCKTFLLLYDCIVSENYKDSEVLYQMMDTLNLLAYIIDDNKDVFKEVAVLKAKGYYLQLSDDEIKKEFREMVDNFSQEIKPILFDLWGYVIRISCDTRIDADSFEYINPEIASTDVQTIIN
jgi:hypothetical protein